MVGGTFGYFRSPGFPNDYPENVECTWIMHVKEGYSAEISFYGRFDIQQSTNCEKDRIEVDNCL